MLQWMGGSRRKVTTSKKSLQNRQKQYFEQRKRQQQATGLDTYADGRYNHAPYHEEHRSLDILSLINIATVAREQGSGCATYGENLEANDLQDSFHPLNSSPKIAKNDVTPTGYSDLNDKTEVNSTCYEAETTYQKVSAAPCLDNAPSTPKYVKCSRPDEWKTSSENQSLILDLLGDDGFCSKRRAVHEAHVAFSIEGLGNMRMETPVHSPRQLHRVFFKGCSSPPGAAKRLRTTKKAPQMTNDIEVKLDGIIDDFGQSLGCGPSKLPFDPMITLDGDYRGNSRSTWPKGHILLDGFDYAVDDFIDVEKKVCSNMDDTDEQRWTARLGFLDDNFFDVTKSSASWPFEVDSDSDNFLNAKKCKRISYGFEDPCLLDEREADKAWNKSHISVGFPAQYFKHQTSEKDSDFLALDGERNPTVNGDWIGSISKQPIWPFPVAEDEGDDLSLLSEESSSSSAVRGMQTKNLASNSMKPNLIGKSHRNEHWKSLGDDINYLCSKQMACANLDLVHEEKYLNGSANYTKEANSLRSKTGHHLKQLSEVLRISEQESLLFEEQCTSVNVSPFHNTSMEMDTASLNGKLFSQPHFYSSPVPMSYPDTESTWKRSKVNSTVKHAPYGSIFAEVQTVDPVHSYASNIFESIRSKLWKQDMQPVHEKEDQLSHSSDISELQKGIQLPGLSGQNNAIQEELRSQARNEASVEKTDLSSGKGKTVDVLEFKDSCSEHEEAKERTPEPIQSLLIARNSPALADEPPPYKESPIKLESYINDTKCYSHSGASVLYQIANNGKENSRSQTRNNVHKGPRTGDQSYQLMLESYVLQLLCVQKILTEASETDIMKKV